MRLSIVYALLGIGFLVFVHGDFDKCAYCYRIHHSGAVIRQS